MIPAICHFIWFAGALPSWAQMNLDSFMEHNPDIEVRLHIDDRLLNPDYQARWTEAQHPATRSDMLRYSILQRFGGIYCDLDWYHLNPLPMPVDDGKLQCVQMHPGRPVNAAMACPPGLSIFSDLQRRFVSQNPTYLRGAHVLTAAHKRRPSLFSPLKGTWCSSALQSVGIYCHAHNITVLETDLGDWRKYTAVHLPSTEVHLSTGGNDADHKLRAERMYFYFLPFARLTTLAKIRT